MGNLRTGDTMLAISGAPYDTLHNIIGISGKENIGSLKEYGVKYKQIDLLKGKFDLEKIKEALISDNSIKLIHIQRSTGYGWRNSFLVSEIGEVIKFVKDLRDNVIIFVDNCYGELIDTIEPTNVGAILIAGSVIKNIGGGIAPTGGYIAGKAKYVEQATFRLTTPG
ncbi:methionine gamma-lyase family protein, partial [Acinetobacter baumannii]|nr:methionine gamma-lyase family protein [Acinetobacter baumannii]